MPSTDTDLLKRYRGKRSADTTPEPFGARVPAGGQLFVVHKHAARQLHWDLRLEMEGVLRSWAVPKGPSPNPADKRLAVLVEDHPLEYANFEGVIPKGNYGAGRTIVWDRGTWRPIEDPAEGLAKGKLLFDLQGYKLRGRWTLVRLRKSESEWLLIKERDSVANEESTDHYPDDSVLSGLTLEQMEKGENVERKLVTKLKRAHVKPARYTTKELRPMLAVAGDVFSRKGWIFELKFDGYRLLAIKDGNQICLQSRNGHDLTASFPEIRQALAMLPYSELVLDGEVVVHDDTGRPSFGLLQQRAKISREHEVQLASVHRPSTLYAFDLIGASGFDLRELPLLKRKSFLETILPTTGPIRYSEHIEENGHALYQVARDMQLEGIVGKRAEGTYKNARSSDWVKVRADHTGDFAVIGFTPNRSNASDIGALLVGEYRGGELIYVGRVGSGLNSQVRDELRELFARARPMESLSDGAPKGARWLKPVLVAEVRYKEYTRDGHLRHPVFLRLRTDKSPAECVSQQVEDPAPVEVVPEEHREVLITNRDKVFWPQAGYTKGDLVDYYRDIAPWMLPYLKDRPIVLTRFPDGWEGKSFYQRDAPAFVPDWMRIEVLYSESAERDVRYFIINEEASLVYLANMATLPIHLWSSRIGSLEQPDWCILDLDPKDAPFSDVIKSALAIHTLCEDISLPNFVKTSGASGLHVLIPLGGQLTHDQCRTLGELLARVIVNHLPDITTIARIVERREGKVYIDFMQNGHGKVLVAPYCVRAVTAASVAMPLSWDEVNGRLKNPRFHIKNAVRRMKRLKTDPMLGVLDTVPDLEGALGRLAGML